MKTLFRTAVCVAMVIIPAMAYSESDEIFSTWVNTNYASGSALQKLIYNFDGTFAGYPTTESTDPIQQGTFTILKKWKDSEGNIWYQIKWDGILDEAGYMLAKLSDNYTSLEYVMKPNQIPEEINVKDSSYRRYNRG